MVFQMTFQNEKRAFLNEKKTFLAKPDKSKKGSIDEKTINLVEAINRGNDYYTTSSCSGRVCLWKGSGKKNETEQLKVSHNLIDADFLKIDSNQNNAVQNDPDTIWLRLEPFILHVACRDMDSAGDLLETARRLYKKSSLLSISSKIIVEIRGSEFLEMPFCHDGNLLFSGDLNWLAGLINAKLNRMWLNMEHFRKILL